MTPLLLGIVSPRNAMLTDIGLSKIYTSHLGFLNCFLTFYLCSVDPVNMVGVGMSFIPFIVNFTI